MIKRFGAIVIAASMLTLPASASAHSVGSGGQGQNPAQQCRQERNTMGAQAFARKYGTNANKRNAFGQCVREKAHKRGKHHGNNGGNCGCQPGSNQGQGNQGQGDQGQGQGQAQDDHGHDDHGDGGHHKGKR